ncbi:MAG TPA: hydrogenase/urease maturation nickel metallochaperone HypA [Longimicrobiales bacterium]|nr:hydrogenase/urease maturation nickel metallochaperone HypA [Longimicrobiales bacterium]
MHEMSLAMEVCRIAEERVGSDDLRLLREVGLRVGLDSGVEPESLEFWLETLLSSPPFGAARAVLDVGPGDDLRVTYLEVEDGDPPH